MTTKQERTREFLLKFFDEVHVDWLVNRFANDDKEPVVCLVMEENKHGGTKWDAPSDCNFQPVCFDLPRDDSLVSISNDLFKGDLNE